MRKLKNLRKKSLDELLETMPTISDLQLGKFVGGQNFEWSRYFFPYSNYYDPANNYLGPSFGSGGYSSNSSYSSPSYGSGGSYWSPFTGYLRDAYSRFSFYFPLPGPLPLLFALLPRPDLISFSATGGGASLGGGGYEIGIMIPMSGIHRGNVYIYDTYIAHWGLYAGASVDAGAGYFTGNSNKFNAESYFSGTGYSVSADFFGGASFGWTPADSTGNRLYILRGGYGKAIGAAFNTAYTNVRRVW